MNHKIFNLINRVVKSNHRYFIAAALIIFCGNLIFLTRAHSYLGNELRATGNAIPPEPAFSASASQESQGLPQEPLQVIKFSLFEDGIYPREAHVDKGLIAVTIEDYSGGSPGVIVDRETGAAPVPAGRVDRGGPHWRSRNELKLEPGQYRVYMADRPTNQALLVVEP